MVREIASRAPDFELANQFGEPVRLSGFEGVSVVVLVFFPLAFSGTCTTELGELRDNRALFESRGAQLLAVSVDSKASLRAWAEQHDFGFPLLADFWPHGAVARKYDVLVDAVGYASRATFVIDTNRIIRASFVAPVGQARSISQYREALNSLA